MLNARIQLAAALLIASMTSALLADVIELEGTVTAVDAKERTITIKKKTLEIAKKCRITVDGEDADLDDLKPDQEVTVEYDDDLDVAKSISVGGSSADGDAVAKALKKLQGEWLAVACEENGEEAGRSDVKKQNRRIVIKGNSLTMERVKVGRAANWKGKFEIDPSKKAFDWIGKGPDGNVLEWTGIYEVNEDGLKICIRFAGDAKRPKKFSTSEWEKGQPAMAFYTLKRDEE